MPVSTLSVLDPNALDDYLDLRSVPRMRHFGNNDIVERLRRAVPFDFIYISGLDVDHYRLGQGFSIDTDLPPDYLEAYEAGQLQKTDPFLVAAKASKSVVIEQDVYARSTPPEELVHLQAKFGVKNRTTFPISRGSVIYGAVGFTRAVPFTANELNFFGIFSEALHQVVTRPLMERFAAKNLRLSKGEIACLMHASRGLTTTGIAKSSGYQVDTVNSYLIAAAKKLNASNRTQAIAEAIRRRLIA
ncbi:LuxR family transcriptional regulator [Rhizobium sp. P38BS-XIX]|uniref:helix-turn-helix transcriptional regulator n=1 Tax=Rhizobium sp. P38BS-XIX TaxID=2726740 RepID=UPI0014569D0E|nr:autoinducer binding domain-containing protein [Rhizobium sp. P38BS-XIX]NLR97455.1 LuxR family transcriptional regulator [Rhizobium sp. P38BS-XIX]